MKGDQRLPETVGPQGPSGQDGLDGPVGPAGKNAVIMCYIYKQCVFTLVIFTNLSFVETPRGFIISIINLRGVSTQLNLCNVFAMKTYKKLIWYILSLILRCSGTKKELLAYQ